MATQAQHPEITFRHGLCSASVFVTEYRRGTDSFQIRTVRFRKEYRNAQGQMVSSCGLTVSDLPKAALVLNRAYEYLTRTDREDSLPSSEAPVDAGSMS